MTADQRENRRRVAQLVAELYDERISSSEFFSRTEALQSHGDAELHELIELVRREPGNTWLFGVSGEVERRNAQRIRELVKLFAGTGRREAENDGGGQEASSGERPR